MLVTTSGRLYKHAEVKQTVAATTTIKSTRQTDPNGIELKLVGVTQSHQQHYGHLGSPDASSVSDSVYWYWRLASGQTDERYYIIDCRAPYTFRENTLLVDKAELGE